MLLFQMRCPFLAIVIYKTFTSISILLVFKQHKTWETHSFRSAYLVGHVRVGRDQGEGVLPLLGPHVAGEEGRDGRGRVELVGAPRPAVPEGGGEGVANKKELGKKEFKKMGIAYILEKSWILVKTHRSRDINPTF